MYFVFGIVIKCNWVEIGQFYTYIIMFHNVIVIKEYYNLIYREFDWESIKILYKNGGIIMKNGKYQEFKQ